MIDPHLLFIEILMMFLYQFEIWKTNKLRRVSKKHLYDYNVFTSAKPRRWEQATRFGLRYIFLKSPDSIGGVTLPMIPWKNKKADYKCRNYRSGHPVCSKCVWDCKSNPPLSTSELKCQKIGLKKRPVKLLLLVTSNIASIPKRSHTCHWTLKLLVYCSTLVMKIQSDSCVYVYLAGFESCKTSQIILDIH